MIQKLMMKSSRGWVGVVQTSDKIDVFRQRYARLALPLFEERVSHLEDPILSLSDKKSKDQEFEKKMKKLQAIHSQIFFYNLIDSHRKHAVQQKTPEQLDDGFLKPHFLKWDAQNNQQTVLLIAQAAANSKNQMQTLKRIIG